MNEGETTFDDLDAVLAQKGPGGVLDQLVQRLRVDESHHELFEALKMKLRHDLGLPLRYGDSGDELNESTREKLELGLIDACREVGILLMRQGSIRDAWMYLRPVGDAAVVLSELDQLEPHEENVDEFIELCLQEGLDLDRGFRLMLQHYGTCNSITTFESAMYGQPRAKRQIGARLLVQHVHEELIENIRAHIAREKEMESPPGNIIELIDGKSWLFEDGSYHVDTTHLSSVVRFARDLEDAESLRLALELTAYGSQLDPQLQYPGDSPFADFYQSHKLYFSALLGEDVDEAVDYFKQLAEGVDPYEDSTSAIEVYVDLLARLGRERQAIDESLRLIPENIQTTGQAPSLLDLSEACGNYEQLRAICRKRRDVLGYALGLIQQFERKEPHG